MVMSGNESEPPSANEDRLNLEIKWFRRIAFALPFILMTVYFWWFSKNNIPISKSSGDWGTFGDFIGGFLNPIFALIAFYWLTRSIQLQLHELKETRKAFEQSSREQAKSAEAQAELVREQKKATQEQEASSRLQQSQLRVQSFESSFFSMMNHKVDVVSNIALSSKFIEEKDKAVNKELRAYYNALDRNSDYLPNLRRDVFNELSFFILMRGKTCISEHLDDLKKENRGRKNIQEFWDYFYLSHFQEHFSSYFRVCYHIVKFIHFSQDISGDFFNNSNPLISYKSRKKIYFDIFRSQLSSSELQLLFFNCLGTVGRRHFKGLAELYGLFEHLPFDEKDLCENKCVKFAYLYEKSAFEDNEKWMQYFFNIEMAGEDGVKNRKTYGIDENQYQQWKNPNQPKDQKGEAN